MAQEISFEWSHTWVASTDEKVRITFCHITEKGNKRVDN